MNNCTESHCWRPEGSTGIYNCNAQLTRRAIGGVSIDSYCWNRCRLYWRLSCGDSHRLWPTRTPYVTSASTRNSPCFVPWTNSAFCNILRTPLHCWLFPVLIFTLLGHRACGARHNALEWHCTMIWHACLSSIHVVATRCNMCTTKTTLHSV